MRLSLNIESGKQSEPTPANEAGKPNPQREEDAFQLLLRKWKILNDPNTTAESYMEIQQWIGGGSSVLAALTGVQPTEITARLEREAPRPTSPYAGMVAAVAPAGPRVRPKPHPGAQRPAPMADVPEGVTAEAEQTLD